MTKVFLGGTCNESTWRYDLIPLLFNVDYYNPVVEDWTPADMVFDELEKEVCDYVLYVLTPKMTGYFSISKMVDESNKQPEKTLFCFLEKDGTNEFHPCQIRSLHQVAKLVEANGARVFPNIIEVAKFLTNEAEIKDDN